MGSSCEVSSRTCLAYQTCISSTSAQNHQTRASCIGRPRRDRDSLIFYCYSMVRPLYLVVSLARLAAESSSKLPDTRALVEDFAIAFKNVVKEMNEVSSSVRNATITGVVDELGGLLAMLEVLANQTLNNWLAHDIDEETRVLYTGIEDFVKSLDNVTLPQPVRDVEHYLGEESLPVPTVPFLPVGEATPTTRRPAIANTTANNGTQSPATGNQTNTPTKGGYKIPPIPKDIFDRPRVGGKDSPLFDDSRPR